MALSRDVVLRLIGDANSANQALRSAADAAGVTAREYKRAETLQRQQAAAAARMAAEQRAAADSIGSSMLKMGAGIVVGFGLAVKAAIDWESAYAGVKKVLKDPGSFDVVEKQLRALAGVLPVTHQEIAAVAAAAAQLGVQDSNVASFTKTMIMLGTTTNLSAEQAATSIARFSNIMGTSQSQASNLGSAIVWLGNNFATTESEIMEMSMRLAGAGKQVGMSEGDVLGLAAALSSVGIEAEAGGSAMSKVMIEIAQSVSEGGDQVERFAQVSGMSADEFSAKWRSDPAAALASFIGGLGRMQKAGGDVFGTLEALGMTEIRMRDALLRSAAAGDTLTDAITGANNAFSENNALQQEAETRYDTAASKMALFRNSLVEAGISVGNTLLPAFTLIAEGVTALVDGFNSLPGPVQAVIAVLGLAVGASALFSGATLMMKGKLDDLRGAFTTMKTADGFMGKMAGFAGMLGPAAAILGVVTAAVTIFSAILDSSGESVTNYSEYVDQMSQALHDSNGALDENVRSLAAKKAADEEVATSGKSVLDAAKELGVGLGTVTDAILGNKDAYAEISDAVDKYVAGLDKSSNAYPALKTNAEELKAEIQKLAGGTAEAADKAQQLDEATGDSAGSMDMQAAAAEKAGMTTDEYAQAQADAQDATTSLKDAVDQLKTAFDELNGINTDVFSAQADMTQAMAGFGDKIDESSRSLDSNTVAGAKNYEAMESLKNTALDLVIAKYQEVAATGDMAAAAATAYQVYQQQREGMLALMESFGFSREEASALLDKIFQFPSEFGVDFQVAGMTTAASTLAELQARLMVLEDGTTNVIIDTPTSPDVLAKLNEMGYKLIDLGNGTSIVVAQEGAAEAQQAINDVKAAGDEVSGHTATMTVELDGESKVNNALAQVGAYIEATPDGKVVKIDAYSEEAEAALNAVGLTIVNLPDGSFEIQATTEGAQNRLDMIDDSVKSLPNGETIDITVEADDAVENADKVNDRVNGLPMGKAIPISLPGAPQAAAEADSVTESVDLIPDAAWTQVTAPGATQAKVEIIDMTNAGRAIPGAKQTNVTAPGATQAAWQIRDETQAAHAIPGAKNTNVAAPGALTARDQMLLAQRVAESIPHSKTTYVYADISNAMSAVYRIQDAINGLHGKTVTITTVQQTVGAAPITPAFGHHVQFAQGGKWPRENHIAQYAKPGTMRIWAEPETGGEYYIPDALSKRPRSLAIAQQMLAGWGMQAVPYGDLQQYAQGSNPPVIVTGGGGGSKTYAPVINASTSDERRIADAVQSALETDRYLHEGAHRG